MIERQFWGKFDWNPDHPSISSKGWGFKKSCRNLKRKEKTSLWWNVVAIVQSVVSDHRVDKERYTWQLIFLCYLSQVSIGRWLLSLLHAALPFHRTLRFFVSKLFFNIPLCPQEGTVYRWCLTRKDGVEEKKLQATKKSYNQLHKSWMNRFEWG